MKRSWAEKTPKQGTWVDQKAVVVIAAEEDGRGIGRIRLASIHGTDQEELSTALPRRRSNRAASSIPMAATPGQGLEALGYKHKRTVLLKRKDKNAASRLLPRVHRVASLLKRWLLGTHQGAVEPEHLDYYLDEFTFRFNRRTSRSRGKLFYRLLQQAVEIPPPPIAKSIGGNATSQ